MSGLDKSVVAKNLRAIMAASKISPEELAKATNLSKGQVDNILYCKALRVENLKKIASFMKVSLESLLSSKTLGTQKQEIDTKVYALIIASIDKVVSQHKMKIDKNDMEAIAEITYSEYKKVTDIEEFIFGIMCYRSRTMNVR